MINVMFGYYEDPQLTKKSFRKSYFMTGDNGSGDAFLFFQVMRPCLREEYTHSSAVYESMVAELIGRFPSKKVETHRFMLHTDGKSIGTIF